MPFKGSELPRTEIARQLGVDAVLDGAITVSKRSAQEPGTVRLDATLIAAGSGAKLWSGFAVRRRGESAALLSDVARSMAGRCARQVTKDEAVRLRQVRVTNPAAEEAYLQGRLHLAGYGKEARESRAASRFSGRSTPIRAMRRRMPRLRLPTSSWRASPACRMREARLSARAEIRKALETGEDIAEAHAAEADLKFLYDWDWDGAEQRAADEAST